MVRLQLPPLLVLRLNGVRPSQLVLLIIVVSSCVWDVQSFGPPPPADVNLLRPPFSSRPGILSLRRRTTTTATVCTTRSRPRRRRLFLPARLVAASARKSSANDDSEEEEPRVISIESLSSNQLLELIELSFFQACLGLSKGNEEPLRLFIVAVLQARADSGRYENPADLIRAVDQLELPQQGRPPSLDETERSLRATWIHAVCLMQRHSTIDPALGSGNGTPADDEIYRDIDCSVADTYTWAILNDLVSIHKSGLGLNAKQFVANRKEILLTTESEESNNNPLLLEEDEDTDDGPEDSLELAIVTQTLKVLYNTLVVLAEEEKEDSEGLVEEKDDDSRDNSRKAKKKRRSSGGGGGRGFG